MRPDPPAFILHPMQFWLVKQEPETYPWPQFVADRKTSWDGVRNFQARNHLRAMKKGDRVLYYHSGTEKAVVGEAEVLRTAYPDPSAPGEDWSAVDLKPIRPLPRPVPLAQIKSDPALANIPLVRQARLSVMPLDPAAYDRILALANLL